MTRADSLRPLVIGIAGGSGCGKTYLAHQIKASVTEGSVAILSMDRYFQGDIDPNVDPRNVNFDHPSHLDFKRLIRDVSQLRRRRSVWIPDYDFRTMTATARAERLHPTKVLLVEGLFVLSEPMVSLCDLTCFLDVAADERLMGRILRDIQERGVQVHQVIDRYQRYVRPSYQIFVNPTKQNANVVVDFTYRRSLFSQLLISLVEEYVDGSVSIESFLQKLRSEPFPIGVGPQDGFMSISTDIFRLAKAYPEQLIPATPTYQPMTSPAATQLGKGEEE